MKHMHRPWIPVLLTFSIVLVAGLWWGSGLVGAQPAAGAVPPLGAVPAGIVSSNNTVTAAVHGAVGSSGGPAEAVVFSGQASISGKVIDDPDFGAPPVLEIVIDLSNVSGVGQSSKKTYLVSTQAVLHRPLLAFDSIELSFPFSAAGDPSPARAARASFGIRFSAAAGITTTGVTITTNPPG